MTDPMTADPAVVWSRMLKAGTDLAAEAHERGDRAGFNVAADAVDVAMDWLADTRPVTWEGVLALSVGAAALAATTDEDEGLSRLPLLKKMTFTLVEAIERETGLTRDAFGGSEPLFHDPRGAHGTLN